MKNLWFVLPVRPFCEGKTRLSSALTPGTRESLNRHLFEHTLDVVLAVADHRQVLVVTYSSAVIACAAARGVATVAEPQPGDLNLAVALGAEHAVAAGAQQILSLSSDLPLLGPADLEAMLTENSKYGSAVIAPDHHGSGTNALLLDPPNCIPYAYGLSSFHLHANAAAAAGQPLSVLHREGLAFDLDTHADLERLRQHLHLGQIILKTTMQVTERDSNLILVNGYGEKTSALALQSSRADC